MTRPNPARIAIATLIGAVVVLPASAATAIVLEPAPGRAHVRMPVNEVSAEVDPTST